MIQIQLFTGNGDHEVEEINKWLEEADDEMEVISVNRRECCDYYDTGAVCNRWTETLIVYKIWKRRR